MSANARMQYLGGLTEISFKRKGALMPKSQTKIVESGSVSRMG
jgi:hypothetical protein